MRTTLSFVLVSLLFLCKPLLSQNYGYASTKDSTTYQPLTGSTTLAAAESWRNKSFGLHLPFAFNLAGSSTDSITIENNGFVIFENSKRLALVAFNSYTSNADTNGVYSSLISYETTGSAGNRICKLQFTNLAENNFSGDDFLNYQVWLLESGQAVEFHIGPNSKSQQQNTESLFPVLMGIINREMNGTSNGYLLTGSTAAPAGQVLPAESSLQYLSATPFAGTIYRLNPTF